MGGGTAAGNYAGTNCIACNQRDGIPYRLQLHERDGGDTEIEAVLCDDCLESHLELEWVEILVPTEQSARES